MTNLFYVVEVKDQWYNLCISRTHYCLSCGSDLDTILNVVYKYVRKYKTAERFLEAVLKLEGNGNISVPTQEQRQERYDLGEHLVFNPLLKDTVQRALKDNREDSPYNRVKKRSFGVTNVKRTPIPSPEEVRTSVRKVTPLKVRRITKVHI